MFSLRRRGVLSPPEKSMHDTLSQIARSIIDEKNDDSVITDPPSQTLFPLDTKTYQKTNNVRFLCI